MFLLGQRHQIVHFLKHPVAVQNRPVKRETDEPAVVAGAVQIHQADGHKLSLQRDTYGGGVCKGGGHPACAGKLLKCIGLGDDMKLKKLVHDF